jgi:glutaredoxin
MKVVVVYTMKGCPFCGMIKEELDKESIPYVERDIDEYVEEYNEFSRVTENEYVPALMLLTLNENDDASNVKLLAPDRDFQDIYEGVSMAKEYILD